MTSINVNGKYKSISNHYKCFNTLTKTHSTPKKTQGIPTVMREDLLIVDILQSSVSHVSEVRSHIKVMSVLKVFDATNCLNTRLLSVVYGGQEIQMSAAGNTVPVNDQKEKEKKLEQHRQLQWPGYE